MFTKTIAPVGWVSVLPIASVGLALVGSYLAWHALTTAEEPLAIVSRLLFTSATLLGFVITALSVLVAISSREFGIALRRSGHYAHLATDAFRTVRLLFIAVALGIAALIMPAQVAYLGAGMVAFVIAGLTFLADAGGKFMQIIKHLNG